MDNKFSFLLRFDSKGKLEISDQLKYSDNFVKVHWENLHPDIRIYYKGNKVIFIAGNPIALNIRSDETVLKLYDTENDIFSFARNLNGSFLIIEYCRSSRHIQIINDRFSSLAFFFSIQKGTFYGSFSLKQLCSELRKSGKMVMDSKAIFEFIYFRRLFGEKCIEKTCKFFDSASVLAFGDLHTELTVKKYWIPDFRRDAPKGNELISLLAERLRNATCMYMSDNKRFGLLLSGGLDSRAVLASSDSSLTCFTTCLTKNNEYEVAAEVANVAGSKHFFIPRPPNLYDPVIDESVFLTGGQQIYVETQFMGYASHIQPYVDSLFIGLGFDIFFGGLYLPKRQVSILGRPGLHYRLKALDRDIAAKFIEGVKYRLHTSDPFSIVKKKEKQNLFDYLRNSVEQIITRGKELGAKDYDLWEYMHLHNLSRHYSFPMMSSIRTFMDCRSPALENSLFDLAIQMNAKEKVNGTAYQAAITKLNAKMMSIRNANTNLKAALPLPVQTVLKSVFFLGNRFLGTKFRPSPSWQERSWPDPKECLNKNPYIYGLMKKLSKSERIEALEIIDMDNVKTIFDDHDSGRSNHAVLLNVLLTLDRFLLE